jgi:hypothetical protein
MPLKTLPKKVDVMLKVEATLIPNRVRQLLANVEGFRQVAPLGDAIQLSDPETGKTKQLVCYFGRAKNTGTIVVVTNILPPHLEDLLIQPEHESAVHVSFFNHPDEQTGRIEQFLDTLQDCYIYENESDVALQKQSMLNHILNSHGAYICI